MKPRHPCQATGCEVPTARDYCTKHEQRLRRNGTLEVTYDYGTPLERFHRKYAVNSETGCWDWSCYRMPDGYGILAIGKSLKVRAHRFAYEQLVGPLRDKMQVCHRCDNPRCVNPDHLFLGTASDNMQDMLAKGRGARRSGRPASHLTATQVTNLRIMYARGSPIYALAWMYGISPPQAMNIVKGRAWLSV